MRLRLHELVRFVWIARIHESHQDGAQLLEVHGLRHVAVEASFYALLVNVTQDVGRERDDWQVRVGVLPLPLANLLACLVAVFVRHVQITEDDGIVAIRLAEDFVGALHTIHCDFGRNGNFGQELQDDL